MPWFRYRSDVDDPRFRGVAIAGAFFHVHFARRTKYRPHACSVCGWLADRQCDWKVGNRLVGRPGSLAYSSTCDRWVCNFCATQPSRGKDLCPTHELTYRAWLAGRTNSTDGIGP